MSERRYGFLKRLEFNRMRYDWFEEWFLKGDPKIRRILTQNGVNLSMSTPQGQWLSDFGEIEKFLASLRTSDVIGVNFVLKNFYFHELEEKNIPGVKMALTFEDREVIEDVIDGVYCEIVEYHIVKEESNNCGIMLFWGWHSNSCPIG
jgi:hypothetical protein